MENNNYEFYVDEVKNIMSLLMCVWKSADQTEETLLELQQVLSVASPYAVKEAQTFFIGAISTIVGRCTENTSNVKKLKRLITNLLKIVFDKTKIDSLKIFFFGYTYLLGEIYDHQKRNCVANIEEEYKLEVMQCVISLAKALTWDIAEKLYTRDNALSLCQMLYVAVEMAKSEQLRSLREASIECIMSLAKVDDTIEIRDIEIRNQIADVFMFFAPGIISGLGAIAVEDEKRGHKVAVLAIRAWGKMVTLQMQDYNSIDHVSFHSIPDTPETSFPQSKWKNKEEVKSYIENTKRNVAWYKTTDTKLLEMMKHISTLTRHSHPKVRLELANMCMLLVDFCSTTIPNTIGKVIEILIVLSEDEDDDVSNTSNKILTVVSSNFSSNILKKSVLENLEENFFAATTSLPRIFSGLDEREQLAGINLFVGYLKLFGKTHLSNVLHSATHLQRLIQTLIHICELEKKDISLYEEYMIQDLELVADQRTPWKNFRYFHEENIQAKVEKACALLTECNTLEMLSDMLLDIFTNCLENQKEATLLINNLIAGLTEPQISTNLHIIRTVVNTYLERNTWNLPLEVSPSCMMPVVQNNIVQICLQLEGLSKVAIVLQSQYVQFLLKTLYPVLEHAGSGHPLIKAAGTAAIANISLACGYKDVTELINANSDYFSYHVIHRIHRSDENESVLNVLATVMKYSNIEVLPALSDIVCGVLLQTCDRFFLEERANAYLRLFQIFFKCVMRWLSVEIHIQPIKSKLQKQLEYEPFQISNLNYNEDDDIGTASAEEMYREDVEKWKQELTEDFDPPEPEYEKQELPKYISLVLKLLQRCVNFLPSKDRTRKLLVLEILVDGFEIIRDWENELLPLVHQIWSPLVERFKEKDDLLIINRSFQLLVTLARLSKDFIRSRTAKDVLPRITLMLLDLSHSSHLQDRGSAYRYTQAYKMQLNVLPQLARFVTDIDLADMHINTTMEAVKPYLSDKQPLPLQEAAMNFYCDLAIYDPALVRTMLQNIWNEDSVEDKSEYLRNTEAVLQKIM